MALKNVTDPRSFEYLRAQLDMGSHSLSVYMADQKVDQGKVYAIIPPELFDHEQLYSFENGGLYYEESVSKEQIVNETRIQPIINKSDAEMAEIIENYLRIDPANCCIFEEPVLEPQYESVIVSKNEYIHIGKEMFYFFDRTNGSHENLKKAILRSQGYYFLCVLSSLEINLHEQLQPFNEISHSLLKTIAGNATAFFAGAYDHEAFLMWQKDGSNGL